MSTVLTELDKKNQNEPKATPPTAIAVPAPTPATGFASAFSSALSSIFTPGTSNTTAIEPATQANGPFRFTVNTSSSPVDSSAENSPRLDALSSAAEKPNQKTQDRTPLSAMAVPKSNAVVPPPATAGVKSDASTPDSYEVINHSATHSPETSALYQALPITGSGESSPLAAASASSTYNTAHPLKPTVRSTPNSVTNSPELSSATPSRKQSVPTIAGLSALDQKSTNETLKSNTLDEISTLRFLLSQRDFEINQLTATLKKRKEEDKAKRQALIAAPAHIDSKVMQEQYSGLQESLRLLENQNRKLESELAAVRKDLALARESIEKQDADERNTPAYRNGHAAGYAQKHAEDAIALQEAEQRRVAAQEAAEAARVAQAATAATQAQALKSAAEQGAKNATVAMVKKQNRMAGK